MGEPRMARVDVSILVREKGAKVKKGKYLYIIASKDFPKGPGNPISGSAYVENTTVNRMALQCLVDALQRIHRPCLECPDGPYQDQENDTRKENHEPQTKKEVIQ